MSVMEKLGAWYIRRWLKRQQKEGWPVFKNWKTTVLGWVAGMTGGSVAGWMKPDGSVNWAAVAFAVVLAALGTMAKDHNTTGGTIQQ